MVSTYEQSASVGVRGLRRAESGLNHVSIANAWAQGWSRVYVMSPRPGFSTIVDTCYCSCLAT